MFSEKISNNQLGDTLVTALKQKINVGIGPSKNKSGFARKFYEIKQNKNVLSKAYSLGIEPYI